LKEVIKMDGHGSNNASIIVFSGDLDKVLAAFVIATGAASMGIEVTMFFTFWGLSAIRKANGKAKGKGLIDKLFGMMIPKGSVKLKLSQMHMSGMGTSMMRGVMQKKNVPSIEDMIKDASDLGIRIVACSMAMDVMGLKREELLDEVDDVTGVASFIAEAEKAHVTLFV